MTRTLPEWLAQYAEDVKAGVRPPEPFLTGSRVNHAQKQSKSMEAAHRDNDMLYLRNLLRVQNGSASEQHHDPKVLQAILLADQWAIASEGSA